MQGEYGRRFRVILMRMSAESIASVSIVPGRATYAQRVAFVTEIAGRLHTYGTTAQRLEAAVVALAQRLDLDCEPWSNPTGLILSFSDPTQAIGSSDITRVIRLAPGENGRQRGDLVVELFVETPTHLSARQKELLKELAGLCGEKQNPKSANFVGKAKRFLEEVTGS